MTPDSLARRLSCAAMLFGTFASAAAAEKSTDPSIEARARALSKDLRCVVCQNQSIDESTAPLATDLKALLRERLAAGDSDAAAKAYLVQRYGNFVLLKPPFQLNTLVLWIGPFLLLAGALAIYLRLVSSARPSHQVEPDSSPLSAAEEDLVQKMLREEGR